ncbi:MAG: hypothetical protein EA417_07190 [Gammaproteobacteria bacterium]|nr:MAG: hypothetical protein EA417_07190 [Gammaproteobacteria bacterium]
MVTRLFASALLAALMLVPMPGHGDGSRHLLIPPGPAADLLLETVEHAVWARDGNGSERPIYVVYSTDCSWSRRLHEESRALTSDFELRWVPSRGPHADHVVSERNGTAVTNAFAGRGGSVDAAIGRAAVSYNHRVVMSLLEQLSAVQPGYRVSYPTLIYRTDEGVQVIDGFPSNVGQLAQRVSRQPDRADFEPAGLRIVGTRYQRLRSLHLDHYPNMTNEARLLRAFPDHHAPWVMNLKPEYSVAVSAVIGGGEWLELTPFGRNDPPAYVHDPFYARMATLQYQVRPARGTYTAGRQPGQALQLPLIGAPVVADVPAGVRIPRTGEVHIDGQIWDQVQVFADGTRGYIPR